MYYKADVSDREMVREEERKMLEWTEERTAQMMMMNLRGWGRRSKCN